MRRKLEYVAVFILFCFLLDWRILRNWSWGILAVLYLPVYLVRYPWNGLTAALILNLALALVIFLVAGLAAFARARRGKSS